jgi:NAD(P)-dependent dehydrogenase (short-subunit alcohol dehydrogenase family)
MTAMDRTGKRAIVTGGASGMGAGIVRALVGDDWAVVSLDVADVKGGEVVREATDAGPGQASYLHCDVSDAASVDSAFERADLILGGLDVLVHAAGIAPGAPAAQIDVAEWDRVLAVNTRGTFLTNVAAQRRLSESGGRIINFASGAGVSGYPGKAHYAASKGAVLAWTRTVAKEWGHLGITVNALAPAISTPMYATTRSTMSSEQLAAHDIDLERRMAIDGKLGDIDRDLVPVILFLAGPGSRFITGQVIAVDGGMVMVR